MASPTTLADHLHRRRFDVGHSRDQAAEDIGVCFVRRTRAIGVRLKAWRKAQRLDQPRTARRIGVCLETVTKLEKGRLATAALEVRGRVLDAVMAGR